MSSYVIPALRGGFKVITTPLLVVQTAIDVKQLAGAPPRPSSASTLVDVHRRVLPPHETVPCAGYRRETAAIRRLVSRAHRPALRFLIAPIVIVVLASVNSGRFLVFPPEGFSLQWYAKFADSGPFVRSFFFSLRLAVLTTVVTTIIGTAAALYVVRQARPSTPLRMLLVAPLQLPGIMTALALLIFYYGIGLGGTSYTGLPMGHVLVCTPYVFLTVSSVLTTSTLWRRPRAAGAGRDDVSRGRPVIRGRDPGASSRSSVVRTVYISLLLSTVGTTRCHPRSADYLRFPHPTAAQYLPQLLITPAS